MANENKVICITGSLAVLSWVNGEGKQYRVLVVHYDYTNVFLTFKVQDIAEICGISVRELVEVTPVVPGQRTLYPIAYRG